jgi:hypothetical protein
MKRFMIFVFVWMAVIIYSGAVFAESDVEKSLKTNFSDLKFDSVVPSPVAGIYAVTVGQTIYYYAASHASRRQKQGAQHPLSER